MVVSLRLQASNPPLGSYPKNAFAGNADVRPKLLCKERPTQSFSSLTLQSRSDDIAVQSTCEPSNYTSTIGSSLMSSSSLQLSHWNLTQRHVSVLNLVACVTAISTTWLFCSAIPTLLAFKRAAESLEKLMDATREELPDTMAAIRLSGMEISDLTMELSGLGQEITQGVRSSTRAVRVAEERLRSLTKMASPASLQAVTTQKAEAGSGPVVARTARNVREGIVKGRSLLQTFFTLTRFASIALNYITKRRRKS